MVKMFLHLNLQLFCGNELLDNLKLFTCNAEQHWY